MPSEEQSTREQIVNLLRTFGPLSARPLAEQLSITAVAVRRHLVGLERAGLITVAVRRQKMGRPTLVYALTEKAQELFPRNYDVLATQLLDGVRALDGENAISRLFAARMEQLLRQYRPRMQGKDLAERVQELAKIQDEAGYMALWEPTDGGFLLKERNCAIYRVACQFQQACSFEIELFRQLLDADITRLQHQVKGEPYCTYLVRERRPARANRGRRMSRPNTGKRNLTPVFPGEQSSKRKPR